MTSVSHNERSASDMHQIGEVAERVGLSHRTVRYYEEMGLITPERRTDGGFRLYTDENIARLRLIMQMKPLGFSVEEMRELLDTRDALSSSGGGGAAREHLLDRLLHFARESQRRCEKMEGHLVAGQQLAEQLRRESGTGTTAP